MKLCIFCSSKDKFPEDTLDTCKDLARWMGEQKHTLVYGGASVGIMGMVADAFLEVQAQVIGIIPKDLFPREIPHASIQEMIKVDDLLERKKEMMDISDAFICFPGGVGSVDEVFEVLTWKSLGCFDKPIILFNYKGFWDQLITLLKDLEGKKVLDDNLMSCFEVISEPEALKARLTELTSA